MATPTIAEIMTAIETTLATTGLRTSDGDQINPPAAIVLPPAIESYHQAMGHGLIQLRPTIAVLVSASWSRTALLALAEYADLTGVKSVHAAFHADHTLGGLVDDCVVETFDPQGLEQVGVVGYIGGTFGLIINVPGA